ncbi:MAG: YdeI/OmpD-associated family protein [Verrucomicrobia bacterium]|nr:YdeI/OmpD-associated family protein [Verrucomicrobiota bacterium]
MPQPRDPRVDAYIARSAPFARPILRRLRRLVHRGCPAATEDIKWGMPAFLHHGILCGMAGFKAHAAFWFRQEAMAKVIGRDGARADDAMGNLGRLTGLADLPPDARLMRYIREAARLNAAGPATPSPARRRPVPKVPADLQAGFRRDRRAAATFAALAPSHRREYLEWILEAKRPETRTRRVATTLEWLAAGRKRNWKYERC